VEGTVEEGTVTELWLVIVIDTVIAFVLLAADITLSRTVQRQAQREALLLGALEDADAAFESWSAWLDHHQQSEHPDTLVGGGHPL
jgi:hypothetical protein